jgi:hypothetical protein
MVMKIAEEILLLVEASQMGMFDVPDQEVKHGKYKRPKQKSAKTTIKSVPRYAVKNREIISPKKAFKFIKQVEESSNFNKGISMSLKNMFHTLDQLIETANKMEGQESLVNEFRQMLLTSINKSFRLSRRKADMTMSNEIEYVVDDVDIDNYIRQSLSDKHPPIAIYRKLSKLPSKQKSFMIKFIRGSYRKLSGILKRYLDYYRRYGNSPNGIEPFKIEPK